ncbi:NPCBM/NEW2 domain-containing protein [Streptomyces platensis]|uniref:NPCBM/NEW2 domain-containing protein n=1 Tax=Streptomyces platensis TaxID=58346 RepID=UPI0037A4A002
MLSARPWTSSKNGWAPVRLNRSIGGHPLTIQSTSYTEGLGARAFSEITYHLGGVCSALSVDVGIDDEVGANGSVVFQIYRDGTKVADSRLMTVGQPAKHLTADLTGGSEMRLVVTRRRQRQQLRPRRLGRSPHHLPLSRRVRPAPAGRGRR